MLSNAYVLVLSNAFVLSDACVVVLMDAYEVLSNALRLLSDAQVACANAEVVLCYAYWVLYGGFLLQALQLCGWWPEGARAWVGGAPVRLRPGAPLLPPTGSLPLGTPLLSKQRLKERLQTSR